MVERAWLSRSKWEPHLRRLQRDVARYHTILETPGEAHPIDPRELLLWAWLVLVSAPENIGQAYARLRERTADGRGIQDEAENLRRRSYGLHGLPTSPEMQVRWLAALVRAIDADLATVEYWPKQTARFDPAAWQVPGYPCYIVPVQRSYRLEDGKERARRATHYHAIVPERLGGRQIELKLHGEVSKSGEGHEWRYGAAILGGMTIDVHPVGDDGFRLTGAPLADDAAMVTGQIEQAIAAGVDALVWPELTVPDDRLDHITRALATDPLADPRRIPIVIAGSWHREVGGKLVNRAVVLQSRGRELAIYDKRRAYPVKERWEAIELGNILPVIVMEDRLVGLAICRDFCDDCADKVYEALGVDLILVPSMGGGSTTSAHERSAKALQSQHGAVSVVVQQVPVETGKEMPKGEPAGYSFAAPTDVHPEPDRKQSVSFRTLKARR